MKIKNILIIGLTLLTFTSCGTAPTNITNDYITETEQKTIESSEIKDDNTETKKSENESQNQKNKELPTLNNVPVDGKYSDKIGKTYKIGEKTDVFISDVNTGDTGNAEFTVNSVNIEENQITSFSKDDMGTKFFPIDENSVDNNLNLADNYVFVCLDITIKSSISTNYYINDIGAVFKYSGEWYSYELCANSAPPEDDNGGHDSGVTELIQNEEKALKIGYIIDKSILRSDSALLDTSVSQTSQIWQGYQAEKHPLIDLSEILKK